jgi:hypothetical protein
MMSKKRAGGLIFLFVGIFGSINSMLIPMGKWNEPGPGAFPLCLSVLLCISGASSFIRGKERGGEQARIDWRNMFKKRVTALKIVILTGAFILILNWGGYLVTASLYLFLLFVWVSRYKLWAAVCLAIFLGAGSWFLFERILEVKLP